jgi:valyl-tRNA synthetase
MVCPRAHSRTPTEPSSAGTLSRTMSSYDFDAVERKWQERWEKDRTFFVTEDPSRPKFYNVTMYPYPSGELHMGHVRNYTYGDLLTRYHMMRGRHRNRRPSGDLHRRAHRLDEGPDQAVGSRLRLGP